MSNPILKKGQNQLRKTKISEEKKKKYKTIEELLVTIKFKGILMA